MTYLNPHRKRIRSEMAQYGAQLRRTRMLEEERLRYEDEFKLDDPEELEEDEE